MVKLFNKNSRNGWLAFETIRGGVWVRKYKENYSNCYRCHLLTIQHTVIRFVSISAKFGICTVVSLNGTLVEDQIRTRDREEVFMEGPIEPNMGPLLGSLEVF